MDYKTIVLGIRDARTPCRPVPTEIRIMLAHREALRKIFLFANVEMTAVRSSKI